MQNRDSLKDTYKEVGSSQAVGLREKEVIHVGVKGEVFFRLFEKGQLLEERHIDNIITRDLSILAARLFADNFEPLHGMYMLAIGTGDVGWDLQNPPAETNTQRSLYNELARKRFASVTFIDSGGNTSTIPTNVVDFTTTYSESEAVGTLVEMGLLGGDVNESTAIQNPVLPANGPYVDTEDLRGKDTLCNYLTFPVINKPATASLTITWRLTF